MTALLVIDIQNDFLPGGALAVPSADEIIPIVNELIPQYELVVASQDWHPDDHVSFASNHVGKNIGDRITHNGTEQVLWPDHCIQGSDGSGFPRELDTQGIDHILRKGQSTTVDSYSAFYDNANSSTTGLNEYLRSQGVTKLHLVGLATEYCLKFTAMDALRDNFEVTVIKDACRGVNATKHDDEQALAELQSLGAHVCRSEHLLDDYLTLFRPVGPEELALLEENNFCFWPPRLPDQPIFYPVLNQQYAEQITKEWNVPASGVGFVTQFDVKRSFIAKYPRKIVGGKEHEELWIPADDLETLNQNIIGKIQLLNRFE